MWVDIPVGHAPERGNDGFGSAARAQFEISGLRSFWVSLYPDFDLGALFQTNRGTVLIF